MTTISLSERLRTKIRKSTYVLQAMVLSVSAAVPILANAGTAHGAQLTSRSIDISGSGTSEGSGRDGGDAFGQDVTYTVTFTVPTAHTNLEGIVIDFCDSATGPITGTTCTAPTGFNVNEGSLALANNTEINALTINAATDTNTLVLSNSTGNAVSALDTISFDLGTAAAGDGITNPTSAGTFYARILTYTTDTDANGYSDTAPGAYVDDGGIALAIANELTITARVQEQLQFCVGSSWAGGGYDATDDCSDISGTAINLGVVDSSAVSETASDAGRAMVRTNAANGVVVSYKSEQNASSGKLKVAGATCVDNVDETDQCFNSTGTSQNSIAIGDEEFGMTINQTTNATGSGNTSNLDCNAEYDADGDCDGTAVTFGYAWDDSGAFDVIAASTSVVDDELLELKFAAAAAATTPTGLYSTTANFVATATF